MARFSYDDGCSTRDPGSLACICGEGFFYTATGTCSKCAVKNCKTCLDDTAECVECKSNFLLNKNSCVDCGPGVLANPRVVLTADRSGFECKEATDQSYGLDLSVQGGYLVKCSDAGCSNCQADHTKCVSCLSNFILMENTCLDCGTGVDASTKKAALTYDLSRFECVDKSDNAYGYDPTQKKNYVVKCLDPACTSCSGTTPSALTVWAATSW